MIRRLIRIAIGLLLALVVFGLWAWFWPPPGPVQTSHSTGIDLAMPVYHFNEFHETSICAAPDAIMRAVKEVRASDIALADTLFGIRQLRRPGASTPQKPLLDSMRALNFVPLLEVPETEIVYGTAGSFWNLRGTPPQEAQAIRLELRRVENHADQFAILELDGAAKAAINFRIVPVFGGGCTQLTTETRIYCARPQDLASFTHYWRLIYPGSALLRRNWLAAVRKRAESSRD